MVLVEINALVGTPGKGAAKPLATVKGTLWFGFILTAGLLRLVLDHAVAARGAAARPSGDEVGQQLGLGLVGQAGARARGGVIGHQVHRGASRKARIASSEKTKRTKWTAASLPFSSSEWPASKTPGTRRPPTISIHT